MGELELRPLRLDDEDEFLSVMGEFADVDPEFRFALGYDEEAGFADYVAQTHAWPQGERLPEKFVPNTFLVAVAAGRIVGRVSLRHELNEFLAVRGGHVGYGVAPSARRRGHATRMLRDTIPLAAALGLDRLLVTCDDKNLASRRVIEANGGVLEDVLPESGGLPALRQYWISTSAGGR